MSSIDKKPVREVIRREVHLIDNLKANMLIENDILELEGIFIDEANNKATIFSCNNMIISIEIRVLSKSMIKKALHARSFTMISSHFMLVIPIHHSNLSSNRDFLFEPDDLNISLFAHAIDSSITAIMTKNDTDSTIKIPRNDRLGIATEILYPNAFQAIPDISEYAERKSREAHQKS
jgi:hypothetical protein